MAAAPTEGHVVDELWRTSLERIQKRFQAAVDERCRLKCYLIQSAVPGSSRRTDLPDELHPFVGQDNGAVREPQTNLVDGSIASELGLRRTHRFFSAGRDSLDRYQEAAKSAGAIVEGLPTRLQRFLWERLPAGAYLANSPIGVWTDTVFELAWRDIAGVPLLARKFAWSGNLSVDLEELDSFLATTSQVPSEIKSPPDRWYSQIDDLFAASIAAIDVLLSIPVDAADKAAESVLSGDNTAHRNPPPETVPRPEPSFLNCFVDVGERDVTRGLVTVRFGKKEKAWALFLALFKAADAGLDRTELFDALWGEAPKQLNNLDQQKGIANEVLLPAGLEITADNRGV